MVLPINPNWPTLFAEGMFGANPFFGATPPWTELSTRLYRAWSIRRGKQFELDLVQPGEFRGQWVNKDGALDPSNTSSPLSPGVVPFRGYRHRAQYPPTVNLLTQDQATGGEGTPLAAGTSGSAYGVSGTYGTVSVAASASAWQGTQVWQFNGTTGAAGSRLMSCRAAGVGQNSGVTYTMSMYVRSATTGANPTVVPFIRWLNESGVVVQTDVSGSPVALTGNPSAAWTRVTFTSTMPTTGSKVAADMGVNLTVAPAGTWTFQGDGLQWEQAAAVSTWALPGVNYPVYFGNVERYPQSWDFNGTYGVVSPVGVDAMTLLSQITLQEAYIMDVNALSPTFFFPLNDPNGSTTFAEQAGRTSSATLFVAGAGGTVTPGGSIASTTPDGTFKGTAGPIVSVANTNVSGGNGAGTVVDLRSASVTGPGGGAFTRLMAVRTSQVNASGPVFASATSGSYVSSPVGALFTLSLVSGVVTAVVKNTAGTTITATTTSASIADGNWHLVGLGLDATGKNLSVYVDGGTDTTASGSSVFLSGTTGEYVGGEAFPTTGGVSSFFTGDMALYAAWNGTLLTFQNIQDLYTSFKFAWQTGTETSGNRYSRILSWAGYAGASSVDTGQTADMGPATDVSGVDALTALQSVVDTENGRHFVGADGTITFQSRKRIFQSVTPTWNFGEGPPVGSAGEIPYIDIAFDYDTTRIANFIQVTQVSTNQVFNAIDATSQTAYGVRNLTRNNQSSDPEEVRSAAYYYLSRYKDPHMRIQTIKIDAAANPGLFPSVLAFELGQSVQITRRSVTGATTIVTTGFIEQITHNGDDKGMWQVELQITPRDSVTFATFTSLRTTLNTGITAGATSFTLNALPGASVNPLRSEISVLSSGSIGYGTANYEGFTISDVQDQLPGYSTGLITTNFAFANNHSAGELIIFDWDGTVPYNWDSQAAFDSVAFAY